MFFIYNKLIYLFLCFERSIYEKNFCTANDGLGDDRLVGCGSDKAASGEKQLKVALYWFGESLDPTHDWDGTPALQSIIVKNIEDNNKRAMALQSGDIDLIQKVDGTNAKLFKADPYKFYEKTGIRVNVMEMNMATGAFQDVNVRKAFNHLINYEEIAGIYGNGATPAGAPFPRDVNATFDIPGRQALTTETANIVLADSPQTFMVFPKDTIATNKKVKNVSVFPMDYYLITKDITVE